MPRIAVILLLLLLSNDALAQVLSKPRPATRGAVSPADITERLERSANETARLVPRAARGSAIDFAWPMTAEEYTATAKHVLVLVSVVTQDAAELPLRRVHIRAGGKDIELMHLSHQSVDVAKGSRTFSVLGAYREDGFYLAPANAMMAEGYLQADFAKSRSDFNLYKLPSTAPDFIRSDKNPEPSPDSKPDLQAVRAMMMREYKGFKAPTFDRAMLPLGRSG
ncbi:hypothetical protein XI06_40000 [Bradyrhizobium sp. CCBAU 11434]|uniref:hypothetical protein n=1 Tax=Bradyrhizobium sp. CCBAU 11434 TaxID=1630885 RepID=UPI002306BCD5|nr:hypothetical protein [Bradyrhizobium sp. CCBAU 11434]MDA9526368.1 hypothetical protein [Bradyrhizobium sp. CCBAU 11434]